MPKIQICREQNDINDHGSEVRSYFLKASSDSIGNSLKTMFHNWFQVNLVLVTNCSEVTHSVPNDLSLYLDYSPEGPLLDYEERTYQSFQISKQTWFTEYFSYSIWYYFIAKYAKITSQMFPICLNGCLNKSQNILSVN
jgi:hypothetical protein